MVFDRIEENSHCISAQRVFDWITISKKIEKTKYIHLTKPTKKKFEDCLCINFKANCISDSPTKIWSGIGMKAGAATFSITHSGPCECGLNVFVNNRLITTVSSEQTFNATIGALQSIAVQCSQNCHEGDGCCGTLIINVHYVLNLNKGINLDPNKVSCYLSDQHGTPLYSHHDPHAFSCEEIREKGGRKAKTFQLPDGNFVTLYKVNVKYQGFITVEFFNKDGAICKTCTFPFFAIETLFLCAPEGTEIKCELTEFFCDSKIRPLENKKGPNDCLKLMFSIHLCLSVQAVKESNIELTGTICQPRNEQVQTIC